jgi:undecaprenyl diphosphate synthase
MAQTGTAPTPTPITPSSRAPRHVAIIMDGNGRWAEQRGLARMEGHEAGTENIRRITFRAGELGVKYLTLWAFSTENWRRPQEEVSGLMQILGRAILSETEDLHRQGAQLRHIGDLDALEPHLRESIHQAIDLTRNNTGIVLTLAFNYGGRHEIARAVRRIVAAGTAAEAITEDLIAQHLYTCDMPDPDLILRTSGEFRTSNFLLWQAAYAEWIFSPKLWPDFGPDDFAEAVAEYARRDRRFGALTAPAN